MVARGFCAKNMYMYMYTALFSFKLGCRSNLKERYTRIKHMLLALDDGELWALYTG